MERISGAVRVISGIALAAALCPPAAAEEKSGKLRIAVIKFNNQSHARLEIESSRWGEWIADADRPQAMGSWSQAGGLGVAWDAPQSRGSNGANEKITIHGRPTESGGSAANRGGGSNAMSMDDTAGKEKTAAPAPRAHDLRTNVIARTAPPTVPRTRGTTSSGGDPDRPIIAGSVPNASAASVGAAQTLTVGGARTETASGQATGKRQHMPIRTRSYYEQPLPKGSVWIRVATPWAACRVGARYPSLELTGGGKSYVLEGVTVASCGDADDRPTEEVAFYYNRIAFNYAQ